MWAISDLSCYCFLNWVMLYFKTISPCIQKEHSSERKGKGPRRWRQCQGNRRRPLTAVKKPPWDQKDCIVQQHHLFSHFLILSLLFSFWSVPAQPWNLSPHVSLRWLVRIRSEMRGLFLPTRGRESETEGEILWGKRKHWVDVVFIVDGFWT